ncbi:hypothetical protein JMJ35_004742 [Cladonia borealis]|uniref:Uncharacterized protein n=1 Tax=Cladonia borealis TaxID=184061 RepID=A0AA39R0S9_9LECA|nr:hypothetical protein JMJ35_004742 [Cladonia borealis]
MAAFAQLLFAFVFLFGVAGLVIYILQMIITDIIKFVKKLYDTVKAHYNRSYDCEYCIAQRNQQAPVEDDGPNIIEEEAKQSFDGDARTIVGGENGKSSVDLIETSNSEERNPLLTCDGQHSTTEHKETFHEDARMIVGEGNSKSSIRSNEKANSEERNPLLKDDGEHSIKEDKESFDEEGRKIFEEEGDISFADLNRCYFGVQ